MLAVGSACKCRPYMIRQNRAGQFSTSRQNSVHHGPVQGRAIQYSTAQYGTAQCCTTQCTVQYRTVRWHAGFLMHMGRASIQHTTAQYIQYSTVRHWTAQHSTGLYSTVPYRIQCSTVQERRAALHSFVQCSTVQYAHIGTGRRCCWHDGPLLRAMETVKQVSSVLSL